MQTDCPAYDEMKANITQEQPKFKELYEELSKLTGENVTKPSDVNSIFITLWAEVSFKFKQFHCFLIISLFPKLSLKKIATLWP